MSEFRSSEFASTDGDQLLFDQLRREAEDARPEFSAALHRRLCAAVRRREAIQGEMRREPSHRWRLSWGVAASLAAASVLAAVIAARSLIREPESGGSRGASRSDSVALQQSGQSSRELVAVSDLADRVADQLGAVVASTATPSEWVQLDQNAKRAWEALNSRVPLDAVASLVFHDASVELNRVRTSDPSDR